MRSLIYKSIRLLFFLALAAVLVGVPLFWFISENPEKAKELNIPEPVTSAANSFTKMIPEVIDNMGGGNRNAPTPAQNFGAAGPNANSNTGVTPGQIGQLGQSSPGQMPGATSNAPGQTSPGQNMPGQNQFGQNNTAANSIGTTQPGSPINLSPTQLNPNQNTGQQSTQQATQQGGQQGGQAPATAVPGSPGAPGQTSPLSNTVHQPINPMDSASAGLSSVPNEDSVIRLGFVNDLAHTLVSNYWPKGTHPAATTSGVALAGIKTLNTRYGSSLKGFSWSDPGNMIEARRGILNYVLSPSMINGLSKVYTEPLMQAIQQETQAARRGPTGQERPLSAAEVKEMYNLYAKRMQGVSGLLTTYSENPEVAQKVSIYMEKLRVSNEVQARFIEAAQASEQAQNSQGQANAPAGTAAAMAQANKDYQKAMAELEQARNQAIETVRGKNQNLRALDNDTMLYGLTWAYRHTARAADKLPAIRAAADSLSQLSNRFAQEAAQSR